MAILFGILGPIVIISLVIIIINVLQAKKPQWLPEMLTKWEFLPYWMHSFEPMDKVKHQCKYKDDIPYKLY